MTELAKLSFGEWVLLGATAIWLVLVVRVFVKHIEPFTPPKPTTIDPNYYRNIWPALRHGKPLPGDWPKTNAANQLGYALMFFLGLIGLGVFLTRTWIVDTLNSWC